MFGEDSSVPLEQDLRERVAAAGDLRLATVTPTGSPSLGLRQLSGCELRPPNRCRFVCVSLVLRQLNGCRVRLSTLKQGNDVIRIHR